jgi:type IV pilus assembly protein PilC
VFRDYWYLVLLGCLLVLILGIKLLKTEKGKRVRDEMALKTPIIGKIIHRMVITRFCRSLSSLLQAGVPILLALEVVGRIVGNCLVMESVSMAKDSVREGNSLAEPLGKSGVFPPLVVKMIAVGEETGAVDKLLDQVAGFYEQELDETVSRLSALVEPVLITGVGGFVAFVILSVMLPVLTIMNHIE